MFKEQNLKYLKLCMWVRKKSQKLLLAEIKTAFSETKNNKTPGEDGITTEAVKCGGDKLLKTLKLLFNKCLTKGITPTKWTKTRKLPFVTLQYLCCTK